MPSDLSVPTTDKFCQFVSTDKPTVFDLINRVPRRSELTNRQLTNSVSLSVPTTDKSCQFVSTDKPTSSIAGVTQMRIFGPAIPTCLRAVGKLGWRPQKSAFGVTPAILLPVNLARTAILLPVNLALTSTATHTPAARVYIGVRKCLKCCHNSAPSPKH